MEKQHWGVGEVGVGGRAHNKRGSCSLLWVIPQLGFQSWAAKSGKRVRGPGDASARFPLTLLSCCVLSRVGVGGGGGGGEGEAPREAMLDTLPVMVGWWWWWAGGCDGGGGGGLGVALASHRAECGRKAPRAEAGAPCLSTRSTPGLAWKAERLRVVKEQSGCSGRSPLRTFCADVR